MTEDGRTRYIVEIDSKDVGPFLDVMANFAGSEIHELTPEQDATLSVPETLQIERTKDEKEKDLWSAEVVDLENRILDLRFSLDTGDESARKRFEQLYKSVKREMTNRDKYAGRQETRTLDTFISDTLDLFERSTDYYAKYEKKPGAMRSKKRRKVFEYRRQPGILTPREIRMLCIKLRLKDDQNLMSELIESEGDIGVIEAGKQAQRNLARFLSPLSSMLDVSELNVAL